MKASIIAKLSLILLFLVLPLLGLNAQDDSQINIDELFALDKDAVQEQPDDTSPEKAAETVDLDVLTTAPTKLSANVSAGLGIGVGLIEWPGTQAAAGRSFSDLLQFSGLYGTTVSLRVDARPASHLRFFAEAGTTLNETSMVFSAPVMGEVFIDYTLRDTVFFRVGRQSLAWGQGRLLGNPANLVSRVSTGVAVRSSIPAGPGTLNGVVYINGSWVDNPFSKIHPLSYAYAGQWDTSLGPLALSLSGHYKEQDPDHEDLGASTSFSFGLGSVNFAADAVGYWNKAALSLAPAQWAAMAQLFWESEDRGWSLVSEYQYGSNMPGFSGHQVALAVGMPKLLYGDWRPALRYRHAFLDNSGDIIIGITGTIAPNIKLTIGLPIVYGVPGSLYRAALLEGVSYKEGDTSVKDTLIPVDNVVGLLLSISLDFSF